MGEGLVSPEYELVSKRVKYRESFFSSDLSEEARIRTLTVWNCDLVGFTPLSQDAVRRGEVAADDFKDRIGEELYPIIDLIQNPYHGRIQYYEGDKAVATFENAQDALYAALDIQDKIDSLKEWQTTEGPVKFKIRQGIATGKVFTAVVGNEHRKIPVITGQAVAHAYRLEEEATDILCCDETLRLLGDNFLLQALHKEPYPVEEEQRTLEELRKREQELSPYFSHAVRDYLETGAGHIHEMTIDFITFPTIQKLVTFHRERADLLKEVYQAHFDVAQPIIEEEYGGEIDKFYRANMMAHFRNIVKHTKTDDTLQPEAAAHEAALLLPRALREDKTLRTLLAEARIPYEAPFQGMCSGKVYIGPLGSKNRRTYTMLGDRVNRAARLMKIGLTKITQPGTIVTDKPFEDDTEVHEENLKGIGKIPVYVLRDEIPKETVKITKSFADRYTQRVTLRLTKKQKQIIGREKELRQLEEILNEGHGLVNIVGNAGYGKTKLTQEFERKFSGPVYKGSAVEQAKDIPDYILQDFVKNLLGDDLEKLSELDEESRNILHHWLGLNLGYDKPNVTGEQLKQARRETLVKILREEKPMLIFNDVHWADENSISTIEWLAEQLPHALITTNYRPKEIVRAVKGKTIEVSAFDQYGVKEFVDALRDETPEEELVSFIYKHSRGIPLYVEEIVSYLEEQRAISHGKLVKKVEIDTFGSIDKIVQARWKNLRNPLKQKVLNYASCMFGEEFPRALLVSALDIYEGDLDTLLKELQEKDFLKLNNGTVEFKHNLAKNAIYKQFTAKKRATTHTSIGDSRLELFGEDSEEQKIALAWDYEHGDDVDKKVMYIELAGEYFVDKNENSTGLEFLDRVQALSMDDLTSDKAKRAFVMGLNKKCLGLQRLHRVDEAQEVYSTVFDLAKNLPEDNMAEVMSRLHLNRGGFFRSILNDIEKASEDYEQAFSFACKAKDKYLEAGALINISMCQEAEKRINTLEEAIKRFKDLENSFGLAFAYNNIIDPYRELEKYSEATEAANSALEHARKVNNKQIEGSSLLGLALIATDQGKNDLAVERFEKAESMVKKIENITSLSRIYTNWANWALDLHDAEMGLAVCEKWMSLPLSDQAKQEVEEKKKEFLRASFSQD